MYNVQYFNDILKDKLGYPRDFTSELEIKLYLEKYTDINMEKLTVIDIGSFEFELPGNIRNKCHFGYLREAQQFARRIGRYRQLQDKFESMANFQAYRDHEHIVVDLYTDPVPFSFYWVAHYDNMKDAIMNGGIILHKPQGFVLPDGSFDFTIPWSEYDGWSIHT